MTYTTPITQLPVSGATTPFWRTELHELDSHRSTDRLSEECDVLVMGAGYAGVSTVFHLLDGNDANKPSIVILEAREACSGASGRNGGHIKPDVCYNILKYTKKYGAEAAASFARFEAANVLAVRDLVEREGIDCDFVLTRAMDAYLDSEHARESEEIYRELLRMGVADLADIQFTIGKEAEKLSRVKGAKCCFSYTAASLWPYKLVMSLLSKLVDKGVCGRSRPPAERFARKKIIFATNGYTSAIAPQFHEKIVPVRGICSRIVAPSQTDAAPQPLGCTYSIRYGPSQYDYLIQRPDRSIIVGGAKQRFWHERSHWYGIADDSKIIEPVRDYFDGLMQRSFSGWEGSDACTDNMWTGVMGWSSDFMPYIGEVPGKPGQFINAGFSGHGMPIIYLASKELACIVMGKKFEETTLPSIFEPTHERLSSKTNEILAI